MSDAPKVTIKLVRSTIGRPKPQVETVKALGLRKIGDVRQVPSTDAVKGMIEKVKFLLEVQE